MKKILIIAAICLQFLALAGEQNKPALGLSRKSAVELALRNNQDLKAVKEGINAARGRASQSGRLDNPVLGAEYGNDVLFSDEGEYSVRASISQKFPLFGRLATEREVGNIDIKLASLEYEDACRKLSLDVENAYLDALEKKAVSDARRALLKATQELAKELKAASEKAEVSALEVRRAESESSKLQIEIMRDEVDFAAALSRLKVLIGVSPDVDINLADKLAEIPPPTEKFSRQTLESRPDWQMYSIAEESANARIALLKAGRFEDVEVGVFFEASESVDEPVGKSREKILGLSFSVPLPFKSYDGGIEEQLSLRKQAQARSAAKENQIMAEISLYRLRANKYAQILKKHRAEVEEVSGEIYGEYLTARREARAGIADVFGAWQTHLQMKLTGVSILAEQARNSIALKYALALEDKNEK